MYSSSIAAVTNYHKRGGLKETQSYYFTILEFGNPVPGKYDCIPSRGSRGNPAPASPGSRGGPHPPARSPALREAGSAASSVLSDLRDLRRARRPLTRSLVITLGPPG